MRTNRIRANCYMGRVDKKKLIRTAWGRRVDKKKLLHVSLILRDLRARGERGIKVRGLSQMAAPDHQTQE